MGASVTGVAALMFTSTGVPAADTGEGLTDAEADLGRELEGVVATLKPDIESECTRPRCSIPIMPLLVKTSTPSAAPPTACSPELFPLDTEDGV